MILLILSILSLVTAVAFAVLAWFVLREDRQRSAARVAALSATALDPAATSVAIPARSDDRGHTLLLRESRAVVTGHPLIKAAVAIAMTLAVIVLVAMSTDRNEPAAQPTAPAVTPRQDGSLELLSMRHVREGDALEVTGLVKNAGPAATRQLTAVVFAFDRSGNFVASGRAPLEFVTLAPGEESPFHVTIPNVSDVGRYRVSFRSDTGVVRHVDRRAALEAAAR